MSGLTVEPLLDAADELAASAETIYEATDDDDDDDAPPPSLPRPDLTLPPDYDPSTPLRLMEIRDDDPRKGRGWYARADILEPGTVLLAEKPLAMVMGWEEDEVEEEAHEEEEDDDDDDEEEKEDCGAGDGDDASMDDNDDGDENEDEGPTGAISTGLLALRLAEAIRDDPSLWTGGSSVGDGAPPSLSGLFPRDDEAASALPPWSCRVPSVNDRLDRSLSALESIPALLTKKDGGRSSVLESVRKRLPLVVRYNCLSVETSGELFVHPGPGGHSVLSGTAVYPSASFFNHSRSPNVSRWAVGDVMMFVTNRPVKKGEQLVISYVEHEVLCEDSRRRTAVLGMDFEDEDEDDEDHCGSPKKNNSSESDDESDDEDSPFAPVVDATLQQEIMGMSPFERLDAIDDLLQQAQGKPARADDGDGDDDEGDEPSPSSSWFRCDSHQLRILRALTLDGMGRHSAALEEWETCVSFADECLPPLDEGGVALRVQAALCAYCAGTGEDGDRRAKAHAERAVRDHSSLFGGGTERFRRRYRRELRLKLRPETKREGGTAGAVEVLFPLR